MKFLKKHLFYARNNYSMQFFRPTFKKVLVSFVIFLVPAFVYIFTFNPMSNCTGAAICNIPDANYIFFIADTGVGLDIKLLGETLGTYVLSYIAACTVTLLLYKGKSKKHSSRSTISTKLY